MSYSTITLFRNVYFYPNQNYKIDDIENFLNSYLSADKKIFNKQQYWKINGINKEFKLDIPQSDIKNIHEFNYAKVEMFNDEGEIEYKEWTLYYFITNFEWIARKTIKLYFRLDSLNTFLDGLTFHPKTFIEREHISRWDLRDRCYILDSENQKITLLRNIPELNENLNPQKYSFGFNSSYNFILENNTRYLIDTDKNNTLLDDYWIANYMGLPSLEATIGEYTPLIFIQANTTFYIREGSSVYETTSGTFIDKTSNKNQKILLIPYAPSEDFIDTSIYTRENPFYADFTSDFVPARTRYAEAGKYLTGILYQESSKFYKTSPEIRISRKIKSIRPDENISVNFDEFFSKIFTTEINYSSLISNIADNGFFNSNGYSNESSLYSSEFLQFKFYYGDNEYIIGLEDYKYNGLYNLRYALDFTKYPNSFISITYSYSVYIDNSIFFRFGTAKRPYVFFDIEYKKENGDLLIAPLSSQMPLVSSEYLNYIRNGYNYDIKIRDAQRAERTLNLGINAFGTSAKLGLGLATGGTAGALLGGKAIGGATGLITGAINDYYETMKEDLEMEKNITQLKGSKLSVEQISGGIDKMKHTTNYFKLGMAIMISRKSYWKYLEDYFYYFGNKSQYYGIPTHNNRCLFDYLKCKAEFVNKNSLPTQEALTDIISRLNLGVVFIHKFMNKWTFDSDYKENIEVALYNIINPTKNKNKEKKL